MKAFASFAVASLLVHASALADYEQLLGEMRRAGQKLGFTAIHQVRATYIRERQTLQTEELWLDLNTGAFKKIVHATECREADPLGTGNLPENLPLLMGTWKTEQGNFSLSPRSPEWKPNIDMAKFGMPRPPRPEGLPASALVARDEREMFLSMLSEDWSRASGAASMARFQEDPTAPANYGPLVITAAEEEKRERGSVGSFEEESILWHGLLRHRVRKMNGVLASIGDTEYLKSVNLVPPPELVAELKRMEETFSKIDFSKAKPYDPSKPLPFSGPPRPTFGFTFAPVTGPLELRVASVYPGSPADRAGLKEGNVITGIDNRPFAELQDRKELFARISAVQEGDFTVKRGEEVITVPMAKVNSSTFVPAAQP